MLFGLRFLHGHDRAFNRVDTGMPNSTGGGGGLSHIILHGDMKPHNVLLTERGGKLVVSELK